MLAPLPQLLYIPAQGESRTEPLGGRPASQVWIWGIFEITKDNCKPAEDKTFLYLGVNDGENERLLKKLFGSHF